MEKVLDFIKSRYKVLIPIMVVFVLLITVYYFYREYRYDNYRNKEEANVYQYFNGIRTEYKTQIVYNLNKIIVDINPLSKKVNYTTSPIYYSDVDKVIFPKEMSIVFPLKDGSQFKLYKYATYEYSDETHSIKNNNQVAKYNAFFLYDGDDLFFFPDAITLKIDGKDYVELGKMSYVKLVGGYTLEYYDKENNKSEFLEVEGKKIEAYNSEMEVNLVDKYLVDFGNKISLFSPQNLKSLNN